MILPISCNLGTVLKDSSGNEYEVICISADIKVFFNKLSSSIHLSLKDILN